MAYFEYYWYSFFYCYCKCIYVIRFPGDCLQTTLLSATQDLTRITQGYFFIPCYRSFWKLLRWTIVVLNPRRGRLIELPICCVNFIFGPKKLGNFLRKNIASGSTQTCNIAPDSDFKNFLDLQKETLTGQGCDFKINSVSRIFCC